MDPNTNTREEFTTALLQQPVPDDADDKWKQLNQTLKELALKLLEHDAMRNNKVQPFMTPAANKNRVYFLWDSTTRLLASLYQIPWQQTARTPQAQKFWRVECVEKSKYLASLMVDNAAADPLARMLNQAMSQGGETVELGDDIVRLGQTLIEVASRSETA